MSVVSEADKANIDINVAENTTDYFSFYHVHILKTDHFWLMVLVGFFAQPEKIRNLAPLVPKKTL